MSESIHWFFYNLSEHDLSFNMDKNLENLGKNEALNLLLSLERGKILSPGISAKPIN